MTLAKRFMTTNPGPPRFTSVGDALSVWRSLNLILDAATERARLGLLARFPDTAEDDALAQIGKDRRVVRGIDEPPATYAPRLKAWLDDRRKCGSPFGLMKQLAAYVGAGSSFRTVDNSGNWFSRSAAGVESYLLARGNWNWDGDSASWSRFWVIIYPGTRWTQITYGSGLLYGDGHTYGSSATLEHVQTTRAIVADWKPAHTICPHIILAFDAASFDPMSAIGAAGMPDGTWHKETKVVAGVVVKNRLDTACYWPGVTT